MHPTDAAARCIAAGDICGCSSDAAPVSPAPWSPKTFARASRKSPTGAWYDPADPAAEAPLCVHGNPNVLTRDAGTSRLAQGCTGQITVVEIERFTGNLPPIRAFDPPEAMTDCLAAE